MISGDEVFLQPYINSKKKIPRAIHYLKNLIADNHSQVKRIDSLQKLINIKMLIVEKIQDLRRREDYKINAIQPLLKWSNNVMDSIRANIANFQGEENRLLVLRQRINDRNIETTEKGIFVLLGSFLFLLVMLFASAAYYANFRTSNMTALSQLDDKVVFFSKNVDDILKGISDPFFAPDKKFNFIFLNAAFQNAMMTTSSPLMGKNFFEVFPRYTETVMGEAIKEVMNTRKSNSFEDYDAFLDKWQDVAVYPTSEGVSVIIKDISKRKLNEKESAQSRQLLEDTSLAVSVGGWEANMIDNKVCWTKVAGLLFETGDGYKPNLNNLIEFYKKGPDRQTIIQLINECIYSGKGWDAELKIITVRGNERWIRTTGRAEFQNNECSRLVGILQDIRNKHNTMLIESEK